MNAHVGSHTHMGTGASLSLFNGPLLEKGQRLTAQQLTLLGETYHFFGIR